MNKIKIISICILVAIALVFFCYDNDKENFNTKDFSNSLNYYYEVTENGNSFLVKIYSKENDLEFLDESNYGKLMRFYICWDEHDDKLWIWSSDIGFFIISKEKVWIKQIVDLSNTTKEMIPSRLLENVPPLQEYFK